MKQRYFCHREDFRDLTKEELMVMLRGNKRFKMDEFIEHYNIPIDKYIQFLRDKGMVITKIDRWPFQRHMEAVSKEEKELSKRRGDFAGGKSKSIDWMNVDEIPRGLICAIFNVDFEVVNGKRFYDVEQLDRAKEELRKKIEAYTYDASEEQEYSKLRHIDLIAMRVFRGYDRKEFSKLSSLSMYMINLFESKTSKVPKLIADTYVESLKIKKRHIVQLREILAGKSKEIVDDRAIPPMIKLKVWRNYKGKCAHCGSKDKLHYHHIKHFANGGRHTEDNLKLLCASCHAEEHKGERVYAMLKKIAEGE